MNGNQTNLTEHQDQFLVQMSLLISNLNQSVTFLNEQKQNLYTIVNILARIEDKLDNMMRDSYAAEHIERA